SGSGLARCSASQTIALSKASIISCVAFNLRASTPTTDRPFDPASFATNCRRSLTKRPRSFSNLPPLTFLPPIPLEPFVTEQRPWRDRFVCSASSLKGGYYAFQAPAHSQCGCFDFGGLCRVGSKQHGRKDAPPYHAKDAPSKEHRTGSVRICARSPQAE